MDEKLCFIAECLRGEVSIAALCEDYGISRKTGYKWLAGYRELGPEGLVDRSHAPHRHGCNPLSLSLLRTYLKLFRAVAV